MRFGTGDFIVSLVNDGLLKGVGVLLSFVPQIFILFFLLSILEDSGYMARAAYVADRIMRIAGLHGKSFVCMIVGLGCNVPGIMATRTLQGKRDRLLSILLLPFMSCTARLPVYVLFAGAFYPGREGLVIISMYVLGMLGAILTGRLAGRIGAFLAPLLEPAGFGNWQAATALISGIFAKETVVSTLGVVYSESGDGLAAVLQQQFTPLSAYCFMVMTLFYIPCAAAIAAIKKETNS